MLRYFEILEIAYYSCLTIYIYLYTNITNLSFFFFLFLNINISRTFPREKIKNFLLLINYILYFLKNEFKMIVRKFFSKFPRLKFSIITFPFSRVYCFRSRLKFPYSKDEIHPAVGTIVALKFDRD